MNISHIMRLLGFTGLGTAAGGILYQSMATAIDESKYPPPGRLIDLGGYRMHLYEMGEKADKPTVILEAGASSTSLDWCKVQPAIARFAHVCSYDRGGYGWSDESLRPRTASQIAAELHALLEHAGVPGPYILVGHSLGGLYIRAFAALYPDDTAGLILVDATPEDLLQHMPKAARENKTSEALMAVCYYLAPFGIPRLLLQSGQTVIDKLPYPSGISETIKALDAQPKFFKTVMREYHAIPTSFDEVRKSRRPGMFGDKPLVVLSQNPATDRDAKNAEIWQNLQEDFLSLSNNSRRVVAERNEHYIQLEEPELVVDAVKFLVS